MIHYYYYNQQIRKYLLQFAGIFSGMQVMGGKGEDGADPVLIKVPVRYGSADRVVAAIQHRNTQNVPIVLPMMSCRLAEIELAPERRKGVGIEDNRKYVPAGGLASDAKAIRRYMPIPYNLITELSIYGTSTDECFQILEQILMIFDPMVQIQKSDKPFDWTKLTHVELIGISNEENYPMGAEKRVLVWTLNFTMPVWISPPADVRDEIVKNIIINIGNLDSIDLKAYGTDGEPDFMSEIWAQIDVQPPP